MHQTAPWFLYNPIKHATYSYIAIVYNINHHGLAENIAPDGGPGSDII